MDKIRKRAACYIKGGKVMLIRKKKLGWMIGKFAKEFASPSQFGGKLGKGILEGGSTVASRTDSIEYVESLYTDHSNLLKLPPPGEGVKGLEADKWCTLIRHMLTMAETLGQIIQPEISITKEGEDDQRESKEEAKKNNGVVTTIAGGFCGGGETSSAHRRHTRTIMSVRY
ncbi:hypothetical protein SESBI_34743 [Sesbania bispinosa]|nr:hypothetical protein SESBI_34743 [Sesbania bispinosa]